MGALALAFTCALGTSAASAQAAPPAARTRYTLSAQLDPVAHRVHVTARIRFLNHAEAEVSSLVLHLYPNAFANEQTVFARQGGLKLRDVPFERRGGLELHSLTAAYEDASAPLDLLERAERELLPGDRTQLRVVLPASVPPGGALEIRARATVSLPSLVARMGQARDFCMIAQWFPKLAKLLPTGAFRSAPYYGTGEFDADFADYDVTIETPADFVVAAPGELVEQQTSGANQTQRYVLTQALDFAWATAPDLQRVAVKRDRVRVEVFAPKGYSALASRQARRASDWLATLERWLGAYPHARLVIVLPPAHARGAAGMEYPGLFTGWVTSPWAGLLPALSAHDTVTAHELVHQWFPMVVASNEVEHPVLDEGLTEWLSMHLLHPTHARALTTLLGSPIDAFDLAAARLSARGDVPSSWSQSHALALRDLSHAFYLRPAVVLQAIAKQHGSARLVRALGRYAHAHRFQHVEPKDFTAALDAEYGEGFSERVVLPALAGEATTAELPTAHAAGAGPARHLSVRALALAQRILSWVAP